MIEEAALRISAWVRRAHQFHDRAEIGLGLIQLLCEMGRDAPHPQQVRPLLEAEGLLEPLGIHLDGARKIQIGNGPHRSQLVTLRISRQRHRTKRCEHRQDSNATRDAP